MRYRDKTDAKRSPEEHLKLEAQAHDEEYGRSLVEEDSLKFSKESMWRINDLPFKKGTYKRGRRKRRLYELLDLERIDGKTVLEIGCGKGRDSVFFAMYGARVSGFDISEVGIRVAKRTAEANGVFDLCEFCVASATDMPYDDECFDVVIINAVLHHVLKYPHVREETYRILKPGGTLYISEGVRDNILYRITRRCMRIVQPRRYLGDVDVQLKDLRDFTEEYSEVHVEQFSLAEKFVEGIARYKNNNGLVRIMFRCADIFDRLLLSVIPPLRRFCLEAVVVAKK